MSSQDSLTEVIADNPNLSKTSNTKWYCDYFVGAGPVGFVHKKEKSIATKYYFSQTRHFEQHERLVYERLGSHPRILKYMGPGYGGIVLEYHPRGCLRNIIKSKKEIQLIKWAEQIAEGLEYIHQKGVIHCDVGSPNILIKDNSDVVLCDFDAASIDGIKKTETMYESRCNRREIECLNSPDDFFSFNVKDDLFALGSVLYEISTGSRPHEDESYPALYDNKIARFYAADIFPDLSGLKMAHIINKCWKAGYESASEVLVDTRRSLL
jgi:serine/threonine protein kinase